MNDAFQMDFKTVFQIALAASEKFAALRQAIVDLRRQRVDKSTLLAELESFREYVVSEADEDVVLEVMDCLAGFCSSHMRID